jgi:hypothetical protein
MTYLFGAGYIVAILAIPTVGLVCLIRTLHGGPRAWITAGRLKAPSLSEVAHLPVGTRLRVFETKPMLIVANITHTGNYYRIRTLSIGHKSTCKAQGPIKQGDILDVLREEGDTIFRVGTGSCTCFHMVYGLAKHVPDE